MAASAAKAAPGESAAYEHGRPAVRGPLGVSPAGSRRHFGPDVVSTVPIRFDDQPRTAAPEVRPTVAHCESCGWGEERDAQPRQGRQRAGVSVRSCAVSVAPTGATGSEPSIPRLTPLVSTQVPSLPARNEWGESRREGKPNASTSSPPALSSFLRQEEREETSMESAIFDLGRYRWLTLWATFCRTSGAGD